MCRIQNLDFDNQVPSKNLTEMRESDAKFALLMFYLYCKKEDMMMNGSYCEKFNNEQLLWSKKEETVFWKQGFQMLQNIDDRMTLSSQVKRARNPVTLKISPEEAQRSSKQLEEPGKVRTSDKLPDISLF